MPTASSRWNASRRALLALALCAAAGAQAQQPAPVIREIVFRGNEVTQPITMLREMSVKVGGPADAAEIERSRQGVQDLALFRSVHAETEPVEGGVRLVIVVKEKFYILPLPRADYSSDGGYGYGAQLRWSNVWGLNHTFTPYFERRQPSEGSDDPEKRGVQTRGQLRYTAPFIFDTKFGATFAAGYFKTPYLEPIRYDETNTFVFAGLSRKLSEGRSIQGWTAGAGLTWQNDSHSGALAPVERGRALFPSVGLTYRDLHFNIYADEGSIFGANVASASEDVSSDYTFTSWGLGYSRYWRVGDTAYQNLNLHLNAAERHDNDADDAFAVGGVETIRGFEPETGKGDAYYAASVEYLRPVFRNSVRALVVFDAANAFPEPGDANFDKVYASAGVGVRVRFQAFVALDLEIGVAWPLNGGGPRLFASKV